LFLTHDFNSALNIFNEILNKGFDGHHFIIGLAKHFRDILVSKDKETVKLLEVGETIKEKYLRQAQIVPLQFIFQALNIANACDLSYKLSQDKRLQVELALINISMINYSVPEKLNVIQMAAKNPDVAEKTSNSGVNSETKSENQNKLSSISIKDALKKEPEISHTESKQEEPLKMEEPELPVYDTELTQDQLNGIWEMYTDSIRTDKPRIFNILNSSLPKLKGFNTINLELRNTLQKESVEKIQSELIAFISARLKNINLNLEINIIEESEQKHLYTDTDKFKYLIEKNPNLSTFKQKFGLDF
jgi:DNA polymerase-3 subunit gamma/tau